MRFLLTLFCVFAFGTCCVRSQHKPAVVKYIQQHIDPSVLNVLGWTPSNICRKIERVERSFHGVELFSGSEGLSNALRNWGLKVISIDIKKDAVYHDLTTPRGRAVALMSVLSVLPGGLIWAGFPCTTYVWMSRSVNKRPLS
eukprot:4073861-Karenia_brevis.AAC.1